MRPALLARRRRFDDYAFCQASEREKAAALARRFHVASSVFSRPAATAAASVRYGQHDYAMTRGLTLLMDCDHMGDK